MFTGIVEKLAPVTSLRKLKGRTFSIALNLGDKFSSSVRIGDSIAVNGTCLTVTTRRGGVVVFDVIEETLQRTNLGKLSKGSKVNVERSLLLSDRIDGHLVAGHIDGVGKIQRTEKFADGSLKMWIAASPEIVSSMIQKGSVAVDGVSLTLVDVTQDSFSFCLIPHTLKNTTLGYKKRGDYVNIEVDMIGKFVRRLLEKIGMKGALKSRS